MARNQSLIKFLTLCVLLKLSSSQPYANDFPYMKYGFKSEGMHSDTDGNRYLKNNLRDRDDRLKSSNDKALSYNLDSDQNEHNINQLKRGGSTDNLTHLQGENFENDKTHKRKHVKSGFVNSYHKDENGSRSSFYEDSDDTGGKVVYDKRHGTRGDNQENQFQEGLKNGVSKDRYDDRRTGYDSRDLIDQNRYHAEDYGKQQGYADNYRGGVDDRFEVIRRPHSDLNRNQPFSRIRDLDNYDRYNPSSHWGYNNRLPLQSDSNPSSSRDFYSRRKITIYEDPRDEFVDPKLDRFRDNGNFMARSEITRRFDYGPSSDERTPFKLRYRGI